MYVHGIVTCVYMVVLRVCKWCVDVCVHVNSNVCVHVIVTCVYMVGGRVCTWYSNVCAHGGSTCMYMV